jgi:hypothetical protein
MSTPEQLARQLDGLVDRTKRRSMERVVKAGERFAKQEAPVRKGHLRRSLTSRVERGGDVGRIGTNLTYARAVHEGLKPYVIKPKRPVRVREDGRKVYPALFWKGARHPVRSVKHPGIKANPFLRRAADRLRSVAAAEFGRDVFSGVR